MADIKNEDLKLIRDRFPFAVTLECTRKKDGKHFHHYTQMRYVLSGTLKHNIFGKEYVQRHGTFILVPPYTRHSIDTSESDDTPVFVSISFVDSFLTDYGYRYFSFTQPNVRFEEHDIPNFCELTDINRELADMLVRRMFSEFSKHYDMDYDILRKLLVEFIHLLCRGEQKKEDVTLAKERSEAISKAVDYILVHYKEKITIDELCQISVMSRRLFTENFKIITGLTVADFISFCRGKRVCYYILFTTMSLGEIAELCGFYDKAHLSRTFTKLYGVSPTKYREQNQKNALIMAKEEKLRWGWIDCEDNKR